MNIEDYKEVISTYQQKCFELLNENIVLKSQISAQGRTIEDLTARLTQQINGSEGFKYHK